MVQGVVDTMLNRVASPQFPNTVEGVANQSRQFSKITGPRRLDPYGAVDAAPVASKPLQRLVDSYIGDLMAGAPQTFEGSVNYLNPYESDQSNLDAWGNAVVAQGMPAGAGQFVHYHGAAPGFSPYSAEATGELSDFEDVSRAQVGIGLGMKGPLSADAIDRANERGGAIYNRMNDPGAPEGGTLGDTLRGVIGAPITGAMRLGAGLSDIASGVADRFNAPISTPTPPASVPQGPQSLPSRPISRTPDSAYGGAFSAPVGPVDSAPLAPISAPSYTPSSGGIPSGYGPPTTGGGIPASGFTTGGGFGGEMQEGTLGGLLGTALAATQRSTAQPSVTAPNPFAGMGPVSAPAAPAKPAPTPAAALGFTAGPVGVPGPGKPGELGTPVDMSTTLPLGMSPPSLSAGVPSLTDAFAQSALAAQPSMPSLPAAPPTAPRPQAAAPKPMAKPLAPPQPSYVPGTSVFDEAGKIAGIIGANGRATMPTFASNTPVFDDTGSVVGTISGRTMQAQPLSFGQRIAGLFGFGPAGGNSLGGAGRQGANPLGLGITGAVGILGSDAQRAMAGNGGRGTLGGGDGHRAL